ncbi:hypothetical protein OHU17_36185 (plasmid) [Streptomyces goshikiensis]|uniref:Uncharacterized protein n=1 Tax=Streptomyces goshikiensis TaxID=1942 RepID=A0ABZ1RWR1_9ACTN|nr:hypothetical protein [Streptomyces goshikiensis]
MALLLILPAAGLVVAAVRMGVHGHDRRARPLYLMGAGRRARAWMNLGAAVVPVALGTLGAAVLLAPALFWNVMLPWIGFTLAAADLRGAAGSLVLAVLASGLTVLAAALLLEPSTNRPEKASRGKASRGLPCPAPGTSETVPFSRLDRRLKATTYRFFGDTDATVRVGSTRRTSTSRSSPPRGRPSTCRRSSARHGSP